jgi:hypothetical protein
VKYTLTLIKDQIGRHLAEIAGAARIICYAPERGQVELLVGTERVTLFLPEYRLEQLILEQIVTEEK